MTPHLVKWQEKYGDQGFQVIEIENAELSPSLPEVSEHARGLPFPVMYDTGGATCNKLGVSLYPTAFLVGRDGKVLWTGNPVGAEGGKIAAALKAK